MGETRWSHRVSAAWRWARRMLNGVPRGGVIRLADLGEGGRECVGPAISIVLGQWPGRRVGDAVCGHRLGPAGIRRLVAAGADSGLSDPEWRVHGIEAVPRPTEWVGRWLVGLAEASRSAIVVDTASVGDAMRGRLAAQLSRLAPRADVAIEDAAADRSEEAAGS